MPEDHDLLHQYATTRSGEPFGELVRRHIDLVYAAALRQTHANTHLAREVAQSVFTDLARKAGTLDRRTVLVGWLHTAVRFAAAKAMRGAARRERHERAAAEMNGWMHAPESEPPLDPGRLQPVLDAVIGGLKPREREAVLMRFFERREFADLGARLALSESAARSCVDRALKKMRAGLERRGVKSSTAALALALGSQPLVSAPAGLAGLITTQASAAAVLIPTALLSLTMTKLHYALLGVLAIASGVGVTLSLRLADRERELVQLRAQGDRFTEVQRENLALKGRLATAAPKPASTLVPLVSPTPAETVTEPAPVPAALASPTPPLAAKPTNTLETGLMKVEDFQNVGASTPAAAFQTFIWACMKGDAETLAGLMILDPEAAALGEAYLKGLPEDMRRTYKSTEHLAGLMFAENILNIALEAQVLETTFKGDAKAMLRVRLVDTKREFPYQHEFPWERVGARWGLPISKERVEAWIRQLRQE